MNDKEIKENVEFPKKKNFLNNKKTVSGKALSAWLITMIVIFMLFTFGLGLFLGKELFSENKQSDNKNDKSEVVDNSKSEKENNTRIDIDINDETVQKLFNIFRYDNGNYFLLNEALNSSNTVRLRLASVITKTRTCSDLTPVLFNDNGETVYYCGTSMTDEMEKYYADNRSEFEKATLKNTTKYIDAIDVQNRFKELFSSDYTYINESFGFNSGIMKYYPDKGIYVEYSCECGGTYGDEKHIINSAYKLGNSLFIETTLDQTKINYEFRLENGMYKFVKVVESK